MTGQYRPKWPESRQFMEWALLRFGPPASSHVCAVAKALDSYRDRAARHRVMAQALDYRLQAKLQQAIRELK